MKVLTLFKRFNMGRDSVLDGHGRSYNLPMGLRDEGFDVIPIFVNYHKSKEQISEPGLIEKNIHLMNFANPWSAIKSIVYIFHIARKAKPDVIYAGSDAPCIILAYYISRLIRVPIVADYKDNYEFFTLTNAPLIKQVFKNIQPRLDGFTFVSAPLAKRQALITNGKPTCIVQNAAPAPPKISKKEARAHLGLPENEILIGTAGALTKDRGIEVLPAAMEILSRTTDLNAILVVAGVRDSNWKPPNNAPFIDLGVLTYSDALILFRALEVGVICNKENEFGEYCYPQKYYEMKSCGLPVIAARAGIFSSTTDELLTFEPNCVTDLANKISKQLEQMNIVLTKKPKRHALWHHRTALLAAYLYSNFS